MAGQRETCKGNPGKRQFDERRNLQGDSQVKGRGTQTSGPSTTEFPPQRWD